MRAWSSASWDCFRSLKARWAALYAWFQVFLCEGGDSQAVKPVNGLLPVVGSAGTRVALHIFIRIEVGMGGKIKRLASTSSLTVTLASFFGLRPGFGFAGITHSLEAEKNEGRERRASTRASTYGQPTVWKRGTPGRSRWTWRDSEWGWKTGNYYLIRSLYRLEP